MATPIEASELRRVLGHFLTGVAVVTTVSQTGEPVGLTANSFTSASLDPPLVIVCVARAAASFTAMQRAGHWAVNILRQDQQSVSDRFASSANASATVDKFAEVCWHASGPGLPVLDDCLAWLECRAQDQIELGDHVGFVGQVTSLFAAGGAAPLAYYRGGYTALAQPALAQSA